MTVGRYNVFIILLRDNDLLVVDKYCSESNILIFKNTDTDPVTMPYDNDFTIYYVI